MKNRVYIIMAIGFIFTIASCDNDGNDNVDLDEISNETGALPQFVEYPDDNLYSLEKQELGRLLFWDPILSGGKDVSCASCHHPEFGYADGISQSIGIDGVGLGPGRLAGNLIKRNSPTVLNTAFNGIENGESYLPKEAPMFWDNRAVSLEEQSIMPVLDKDEMRGNLISEADILDTIMNRLSAIEEYRKLFEDAFGTNEISEERIMKSIATFERSLISNNSRFDQYMRGDANALTNDEVEGLETFIEVGCTECHSSSMFSDFELHTLGVPGRGSLIDNGASGDFDFRTPSLRNVAITAPYMHNGVFSSLEEVVEFYENISDGDQDAINNEVSFNQIESDARNLDLDDDDIGEIVAFLRTLTDTEFDKSVPNEVPSKLQVGGNIN